MHKEALLPIHILLIVKLVSLDIANQARNT